MPCAFLLEVPCPGDIRLGWCTELGTSRLQRPDPLSRAQCHPGGEHSQPSWRRGRSARHSRRSAFFHGLFPFRT